MSEIIPSNYASACLFEQAESLAIQINKVARIHYKEGLEDAFAAMYTFLILNEPETGEDFDSDCLIDFYNETLDELATAKRRLLAESELYPTIRPTVQD